ncbi:DUF2510 domain-containing protein [Arthrobacter bambusae]|uniref:DUF2510 domain-containing protein n=1 Tax=Arthrobacter bambusae TaxID=1338426 RepID=A0AAW8D595_9MICC|nr:DUF2510 domain-containing protein [Arthrobacter bambusae]MDP9903292.1 hypothetical protein [Arthrobacter bambusae]MDQ0128714.1 hypothetical protein [Arthrobacter bambusae]MDQ0180055.1 hypothetical protein [Arthrobacter bambusae]
MTDPTANWAPAEPGWYQDPSGTGRSLWWDGRAWSGHTLAAAQHGRRFRWPSILSFVLAVTGFCLSVLAGLMNLFYVGFDDTGTPQPMTVFAIIWFIISGFAALATGFAILALIRRAAAIGLAVAAVTIATVGLACSLQFAVWNMNLAAHAAESYCHSQPHDTACAGR